MNPISVIQQTADYVKNALSGDRSGHDGWHVQRVWETARYIGRREHADLFVVELAALLHDIRDWKFHGGDISQGPKAARRWLESLGVEEPAIRHVSEIIRGISFKGAGVKTRMKTKEGKVVQDADRLDAIGAIGIARAFAYGGSRSREMHNPQVKPIRHKSFAEYRASRGTTINHFYEKLLLLKDRMNTLTAKKMATDRHRFMEKYLDRFFDEWEGKE